MAVYSGVQELEMTKFRLRNQDRLRCSACCGKNFEEVKMDNNGKASWCYVCADCGHIMCFTIKAGPDE